MTDNKTQIQVIRKIIMESIAMIESFLQRYMKSHVKINNVAHYYQNAFSFPSLISY